MPIGRKETDLKGEGTPSEGSEKNEQIRLKKGPIAKIDRLDTLL